MAWQWDLLPVATGIFGVDGQYDFVRATFTDGSNVPRMPPMRVGGGTYWRNDNWFVRMGLLHAFGAERPRPVNDTPTAGYNLLKMEISNKQYWRDSPWGAAEITTGLVGDNLLDVDVRNSVQFHKDEILMPGRSIKFFMNAKFGGVPPVNKAGYYKAPTGSRWADLQGADPLGMDLGRLLCRRHHRLRLGQVQHRHGVQRSRQRGPAVRHQRVPQARGRHRRCARRLQLGCRQHPGRRGSGSELFRPARTNASQLPRRSLQSGACRRCRRPVGAGDLRARPEIGVVRDVARATRCNGYTRCACLCDRRSRGGRGHDRRHRVRFRRRRQSRQHHRQQPQHQGGLDGRRRHRGPPRPAIGPPSSNICTSISDRSRRCRRPRRMRPWRSPSIPASPTTSCARASTTSSIRTRSGQTTEREEIQPTLKETLMTKTLTALVAAATLAIATAAVPTAADARCPGCVGEPPPYAPPAMCTIPPMGSSCQGRTAIGSACRSTTLTATWSAGAGVQWRSAPG